MTDGTAKNVSEIRAGDLVHCSGFESGGIIECVIKTKINSRSTLFVQLEGGLLVTPWHPVIWNGNWSFPIHPWSC